ncbi:MAG: ORF6N domain-containing protein [Candidatus Omnitrophica bacterium]|nr:ORF6N domain-containing protein [Candidatus Omnitrophota bacterium]
MPKKPLVTSKSILTHEIVERKIFFLRGKKVMLDRDLASLYGILTQNLNKAVSRNLDRFPEHFMFSLNKQEHQNLIFHFGTSSWGGTRKMPRAFTEHGILMLSSVLNSKRAIQVNIEIMNTFIKYREFMLTHQDLRLKIEELEKRYDSQFKVVFETLKELLDPPVNPNKRPIGFHA